MTSVLPSSTGFHPAVPKSGCFYTWKRCPSVGENDTYLTTFRILLAVARIACASEEDVHRVLVLRDLLQASGSRYLLTALSYISQYSALKAVVLLSLLPSSWSQGKRTFSHLHPLVLFPINTVKRALISQPLPRGTSAGRDAATAAFSSPSPAGGTTLAFQRFLLCSSPRGVGEGYRQLLSGFTP